MHINQLEHVACTEHKD